MNTAQLILHLLDLIQVGAMTAERIAIMRARIDDMTTTGREPGPTEWVSLFDSLETDGARLHGARQRLDPA